MARTRLAEDLLGMLYLELDSAKTPTSDFAEESKLVPDLQQALIPVIIII
jgi:hypothetical protein